MELAGTFPFELRLLFAAKPEALSKGTATFEAMTTKTPLRTRTRPRPGFNLHAGVSVPGGLPAARGTVLAARRLPFPPIDGGARTGVFEFGQDGSGAI